MPLYSPSKLISATHGALLRTASSVGEPTSPYFARKSNDPRTTSSLAPSRREERVELAGQASGYAWDQSASPSLAPPARLMVPGQSVLGSSQNDHETDLSSCARSVTPFTHNGSARPSTAYTSRRSRAATPMPGSEGRNIICALSEARGVTPSIGVAFVNVSTGEVILSQISDSQFYVRTIHKLEILEPSHVLLVSSSCPPNPKSNLYNMVEEHVVGSKIVPFDRRNWSEEFGLDCIRDLAFREDAESVKVAIQGNYYSTCAFSAVMRYLESEYFLHVVPHSLRIRYEPSEDTMMIDMSAIRSLELLQNLRSPRSKDCLYGLVNHTVTPMGGRLLRNNILQPSTGKDSPLESRYEAVSELTTSEDMFSEIRKGLRSFKDTENMLTRLVILPREASIQASETALNHVISVKAFLDSIPCLFQALEPARCPLLSKIRDLCRPEMTTEIQRLVSEVIEEDVTLAHSPLEMRNARMFAVKSGVSGMLDVARQAYKEITNDVHRHVGELREEFGLDPKLKFDAGRGYWIQFRTATFDDVEIPDIFVNRFKKKAFLECLTLPLKKLNVRIQDSVAEAVRIGDKIIQELLDSIRTQVQPMFRVSESVALLDMLAAFAHVSTLRDYVRPKFTDTLALKAARHPIMEKALDDHLVPNDFFASDEYRFQIITGCNMSGKSTYIRTVALLQIMAQTGCFVPAEYASFPIIHNIFARASTDDNIEANMSTFSVEMREMAFILRNVNERSIAIIDELGRGTSTRDGLSIAIAMAEALIQSRAKVWFATHFAEIAEVLADRPGVLNLHLATSTSTTQNDLPKLTMLYTITSGKVQNEHYGLTLAKAVGFTEDFLQKAEEVSSSLRQTREANKQTPQARKLAHRRRLVLNLHEQLRQANASKMNGAVLACFLVQLQEEFVSKMGAIEGDEQDLESARSFSPDDFASENEMDTCEDVKIEITDDYDEGIDDESLWNGSGLA